MIKYVTFNQIYNAMLLSQLGKSIFKDRTFNYYLYYIFDNLSMIMDGDFFERQRVEESFETFFEATYSLLCSLSSSAARPPPALPLLMFRNCFPFAACGEIFHTALKVTVVSLPCESRGMKLLNDFSFVLNTSLELCIFITGT